MNEQTAIDTLAELFPQSVAELLNENIATLVQCANTSRYVYPCSPLRQVLIILLFGAAFSLRYRRCRGVVLPT